MLANFKNKILNFSKRNFFKKGFTLVEILLYFAIFLIIMVIIYAIFIQVLNNYLSFRSKIDLRNETRNLFLKIQREVLRSDKLETLTDWEMVFTQGNEKVVIFQTKPVFLNIASSLINGFAVNLNFGSVSFFGSNPDYGVSFIPTSTCYISSNSSTNSIYSFSGYAWSPKIGWIKFRNTDIGEPTYGVCLDTNNELRGYAYNDVIGWFIFNCRELNICNTSNFKVVVKNNYLYGYAWNDTRGWLIFDSEGERAYLGKLNPDFYYLENIIDPRVLVKNLEFEKLNNSIKVKLLLKGQGGSYEQTESTITLPFK